MVRLQLCCLNDSRESWVSDMTEKELHKLSREDLLRLLLMQSREIDRQRSQMEASDAECAELRASLEGLKDKLIEKDEQIEQIMKTLDEKEEQLATPRMGTPAPAEHSAARTEEPGEALRTSLCEIDRKLETLRDLIENRDEENRHLWTLLDKMMDLVD